MVKVIEKVKAAQVNWTKNKEARAALAEWRECKAAEAAGEAAKARRKELEEDILYPALDGATVVIINAQPVLKVQGSSNGKVDSAALKAAFPEAYAATYKSTPYTFLKAI